jgi:YihY family inner membrane protein
LKPQPGILPRLRSSARVLLTHPRDDWSAIRRAAAVAVQVLWTCVRKLQRDRASQMASALAFQTLFSLLPLLVLALLVLHSVSGLEGAGAQLRNTLVEFLMPESLVAPADDFVGPPQPGDAATQQNVDDARQVLRLRIDRLVRQLSEVSFAGLGVAGFLLFVYGATALMRTVESSFNLIYQATPPPHWSRLPLYFTLLTLGPLALVLAQLLQDRLLQALNQWMDGWLATPFAYVAPLIVTCGLLALAFRTIPNAWVSWRAAIVGASWSGIAWFAFQEIFGIYVNQATLTTLYGAVALLPLLLLWIYWSWLIILAGLGLSFIVQYLDPDESWLRQPFLPSDPRWLVPIMVQIAQGFLRGERVTTGSLSRELHLPPHILRPFVATLEDNGLVRGLRDRHGERILTLPRPLDTIALKQILELGPPPGPGALRSVGGRARLETAAVTS